MDWATGESWWGWSQVCGGKSGEWGKWKFIEVLSEVNTLSKHNEYVKRWSLGCFNGPLNMQIQLVFKLLWAENLEKCVSIITENADEANPINSCVIVLPNFSIFDAKPNGEWTHRTELFFTKLAPICDLFWLNPFAVYSSPCSSDYAKTLCLLNFMYLHKW